MVHHNNHEESNQSTPTIFESKEGEREGEGTDQQDQSIYLCLWLNLNINQKLLLKHQYSRH